MKTPHKMNTLSECMTRLLKDGFKENFMIKESLLFGPSDNKFYSPSEVKIVNFYRFEGSSDPADSSILYAVETTDGVKGTITDAYGPYADVETSNFLQEVQNIEKKADHRNEPGTAKK